MNTATNNQNYPKVPVKPRFLLVAVPNEPIQIIDIKAKPQIVVKEFPPDKLDEAKEELFRIAKKAKKNSKK